MATAKGSHAAPNGPGWSGSNVGSATAAGCFLGVVVGRLELGQALHLPLTQWLGARDDAVEIGVAAAGSGRRRRASLLGVPASGFLRFPLLLTSPLPLAFLLCRTSTCCQIVISRPR